ncbi:uncharacterized protein [Nicotiana sylvestris]|uniref:uncharacterized protein n=1 Tax=Nicotiana sylvestris TaxID=4096 RepID=UPI00388C4BD3
MTNPQDNPGTPPHPTPSNSSTSPPPSTTPKPRLRRVKMLARKIVAFGAFSRKLNEQLKAKNVEESGKKLRGSSSGEVAKGLVNLRAQGDELGSSTEETLADLLKKVGASYDQKKMRTATPKSPSAPKPSKKRKTSSPTTTETSLPKGRSTRNRVKHSESDLQKALAESPSGGSYNSGGSDPQAQKAQDSSKKSSSVSEAIEPSLAKRTRSVVKSKQVRVSEEKEWSGEEESESDGEQDKLAKFGKRKILKGKLLKDLVEPGMMILVDALAA